MSTKRHLALANAWTRAVRAARHVLNPSSPFCQTLFVPGQYRCPIMPGQVSLDPHVKTMRCREISQIMALSAAEFKHRDALGIQ